MAVQVLRFLAPFFPLLAPEKLREHLEKLREMRDKNIHKSLAALAGLETPLEDAAKLAKVHTSSVPQHPRSLRIKRSLKFKLYGGIACFLLPSVRT